MFSQLFTTTETNKKKLFLSTLTTPIKQTTPQGLLQKSALTINENQFIAATQIILFKTETYTYALTQNENDQLTAGITNRIYFNDINKPCREILINAHKKKLLPPNGVENIKLQKIISKLISAIKNWEQTICIQVNESDLVPYNLTFITSVNCKINTMKKIIKALDDLSQLKNSKIEYTCIRLDSLLSFENNNIKLKNEAAICEFNNNLVFDKWKKSPPLEIIPIELYLAIFYNLNNKEILSFILTSKCTSFLFDENNIIWNHMILPALPPESRSLTNKECKQLFLKRTFMTFNHSYWQRNDPFTKIKSKFTSLLYLKEVDEKKLKTLILKDEANELVWEASRVGNLLPFLLVNDIHGASNYSNEINKNNDETLQSGDFKFIPALMPHILDTHSEKSFDLFLKLYYFSLKVFNQTDFAIEYSVLFPTLLKQIFNCNYNYFKLRFLQLTLENGKDNHMKEIITTYHQNKLSDLIGKAISEIDLNDEKFKPLYPTLREINFSNDQFNKIRNSLEHHENLEQLKDQYNNLTLSLKNKTNEIADSSITPDELIRKSDEIRKILNEIYEAKMNLENYIAADAEKTQIEIAKLDSEKLDNNECSQRFSM